MNRSEYQLTLRNVNVITQKLIYAWLRLRYFKFKNKET